MEEKAISWLELTDYVRAKTGANFKDQCEGINSQGVRMDYRNRFLPIRWRGGKPTRYEIDALVRWAQEEHGVIVDVEKI